MTKDKAIKILAGVSIGLVVIGGAFTYKNKSYKQSTVNTTTMEINGDQYKNPVNSNYVNKDDTLNYIYKQVTSLNDRNVHNEVSYDEEKDKLYIEVHLNLDVEEIKNDKQYVEYYRAMGDEIYNALANYGTGLTINVFDKNGKIAIYYVKLNENN
jgi:hypothetical protein